jgi:hypothetical protein
MSNAKALRAAVTASDGLRALYLALSEQGCDIDAAIAHHAGEVITALIGRIATSRTETRVEVS